MKKYFVILPALTEHGGVRKVLEAAQVLSEHNNVQIICGYTNGSFYQNPNAKFDIKVLKKPPKNKLGKLFSLFNLIIYWLIYCFKNVKHNNSEIRVIYTHMLTWPCVFFCRAKIQYFFWQGDELVVITGRRCYLFLIRPIYKLLFKHKPIILLNSKLNENYHFQKIHYLPMWLSDPFLDAPRKAQDKQYDFIVFARLEHFKRTELALDLAQRYPTLTFLIVSLSERALEPFMLLDNCSCQIPASDFELVGLIDQACALLFTSEYEGFGLPPLECMARQLPTLYIKAKVKPQYLDKTNSIEYTGTADLLSIYRNLMSNTDASGLFETAQQYRISKEHINAVFE